MTYLAAIVACILAEAFFSGSEIALVSSRWARLRRQAERGDRRAALLVKLWRSPDRLLATTLVGTNISVITASVLATSLAVDLVARRGGWLGWFAGREEILVTVCLSPPTLLFGELLPKTFFQGMADRAAKPLAYLLALAWAAFYPVTRVMTVFSGLVRNTLGARIKASPYVTREELSMLVRLRDLKTELKKHETRMIRRLFTFRETKVREVMVPLVRVAAHEEGEPLSAALGAFRRLKYTRYPVYRRRMFNIVGVLNVLDCLHEPGLGKKVGRLMEPAHYVPETKSVVDLLREMEREKVRMAVVVDEYGGAVGVVTLEDVLEEIVGEVEDEFATRKSGLRRIDPSSWEADAHLGVEFVEERLGIALPTGDYETLAGLMIERLGHIPRRGEEVRTDGLTLRALEADGRTVRRVLLRVSRAPHP